MVWGYGKCPKLPYATHVMTLSLRDYIFAILKNLHLVGEFLANALSLPIGNLIDKVDKGASKCTTVYDKHLQVYDATGIGMSSSWHPNVILVRLNSAFQLTLSPSQQAKAGWFVCVLFPFW